MTPWNRLRRVICRVIKPPISGAAGDALSRASPDVARLVTRRACYLPGRGTRLSTASASPVTSGTAASSGRSGPAMVSKLSKLVRASRTRTASPGGSSGRRTTGTPGARQVRVRRGIAGAPAILRAAVLRAAAWGAGRP